MRINRNTNRCAAITVTAAQEGTETFLRGLAPKRAVIAAFRWFFYSGLMLVFCVGSIANAGDPSTACPLLSTSQVSTIVELEMVSDGVTKTRNGETTSCQFSADGRFATVRTSTFSSEATAIKNYREAITDLSRGATGIEPLHGVGTESRLLRKEANTIVARFGVHLVIVTTNGNRNAVVGLARAAGAKFALPRSDDATSEAP